MIHEDAVTAVAIDVALIEFFRCVPAPTSDFGTACPLASGRRSVDCIWIGGRARAGRRLMIPSSCCCLTRGAPEASTRPLVLAGSRFMRDLHCCAGETRLM